MQRKVRLMQQNKFTLRLRQRDGSDGGVRFRVRQGHIFRFRLRQREMFRLRQRESEAQTDSSGSGRERFRLRLTRRD